ncbi:MAG: hypothetical protein A2Y34_09650 [Spirochaetes bacterium GWC1_27_15]|nr:MAG: hypothetical protein A2Z98_18315 [Spirochaetes bacterium GWB1_27_13]OHD28273.1 MAG: hypothetical protein A2Y34_09650 [Spirochaetes bacterium GWC1_27_15]
MGKKEKSELLNICYNYLKDVEVITDKIIKIFNVDSIWSIRKVYFPNLAVEKNEYKLIFHGIGVSILENGNEIIDIENGGDISICGIEPWRLSEYIKSKKEHISFFDNKKDFVKYIKEILNDMLKTGQMKKISDLYFINDEKNRERLKKYKHNNK